MKKLLSIIFLAVIIILTANLWRKNLMETNEPRQQEQMQQETPSEDKLSTEVDVPISQPGSRVTKKPFGIYITAENSPVSPERFRGYHTGTDFEILPGEEDIDVPFYAICDGKILQKRTVSGYGGFVLQSCNILNQTVTVIYGHVALGSIGKGVGDNLVKEERIGVLGQPPQETDQERKHLHLAIHKGTQVNILGYVQNESELSNWIDFQTLK